MGGVTSGRVIAIGDIHGCAAALATIIHAIQPRSEDTLIPLGDFIDRGPNSRGVVEMLIQLARECTLIPILGNHEEMLLAARQGTSELQFWLQNGGDATLASYGIDSPTRIPHRHLRFLQHCQPYHETATHIFAHAYYVPDVAMEAQLPGLLRWTLVPDTPEPHGSGKVVVVGHSRQDNGEILDLGFLKVIDTYCHGGGWLTALDVTSGKVWQANGEGRMRG